MGLLLLLLERGYGREGRGSFKFCDLALFGGSGERRVGKVCM